jgi:hypothetical protein
MIAKSPFGSILLFCVISAWTAAAAAPPVESPTTPTESLAEMLARAAREKASEYEPWLDALRHRGGDELQKLHQWEYKVVKVATADPDALTAALTVWGKQGWECFHVTSGAPPKDGGLPTEHLLFFRKRPASWMHQIPLGDLLKFLLIAAGDDSANNAP